MKHQDRLKLSHSHLITSYTLRLNKLVKEKKNEKTFLGNFLISTDVPVGD